MPAFVIERFGHECICYGETPGKAKYNAWLESESGYDFIGFLSTIDHCRKSRYYSHMKNEAENTNIKKGNQVVMHTCPEASKYSGKTWTVSTDPQVVCGSLVVWLEGYSGCFACEYLKVA